MDWKEYAKELLIFQVKVFSLPIEDVSIEKIEEFKNEFNEIKKMGKLDWDAEAIVENYYDEIGKIVDKLEKLLNDEELIFGNSIDENRVCSADIGVSSASDWPHCQIWLCDCLERRRG